MVSLPGHTVGWQTPRGMPLAAAHSPSYTHW